MKNLKIILLSLLIYLCTCLLSGCWNYKEVEKLAIVSGVAIDKSKDGTVIVTTEIVNMEQDQKQSMLKPAYLQAVGKTFFDAVRTIISLQGKKLYWSHAKVVIISEDIAKEGISSAIDFINRDAELRSDMWIMLSRERTAREIFNGTAEPEMENIFSFQIDDAMRAQKFISRYPAVELYELIDKLESKEKATVIPTIRLIEVNNMTTHYISGAAILRRDKLIGYLDALEAKSLLWLENELKGGLFIVSNIGKNHTNVALELLRSKTKIKPEVIDEKLSIRVDLTIDADIGEIMGSEDVISEKGRAALKKAAEKQIKESLNKLIEKAQKEYKTDFLGFGEKVHRYMPEAWKSIEKQWNEVFADMETSVTVDVRIKGSATTRKPVKVGM